MTKLALVTLLALILAAMSERRGRELRYYNPNRREHFFTTLLIVLLALYCGLRTWFNDTVTYLQMYDQIPLIRDAALWDELSISKGVGFDIIMSLLKTAGCSSQDFLMFFAILTMIAYVLFIRRYCRDYFTFGIFLLFATGAYTFAFAAVKQCAATAVCMCAIPYAEKKRWGPFMLTVLGACLLHPYAIVYMLTPVLCFRPWGPPTYGMILGTAATASVFPQVLQMLVDLTDKIDAGYSLEDLSQSGVNIFRVLVAFVPVVLSFIYQKNLFFRSSHIENLMMNLAMMNALIMCIGLFGTANYFARLANYFLPAQIVSLTWILSRLGRNDRKFLSTMCVLGYSGYFYYGEAILKSFDDVVAHVSLWTYISSHF